MAHVQGVPATVHALVFAAGAILSSMLIGVLASGRPEHLLRPPKERDVEVWGALRLPVVGVAVGPATAIAQSGTRSVPAPLGHVARSTPHGPDWRYRRMRRAA